MRDHGRSPHEHSRRGFTLVEVLVAIILINVGVLALVAGSAVVIRQANDVRARTAAVRAALNRLEVLGLAPCAVAVGTVGAWPGVREQWTVAPLHGGIREVVDSVAYTLSDREGAFTLRTRMPC